MNSLLLTENLVGFFLGFCSLLGLWGVWSSFITFFFKRNESSSYECGFEPLDNARSKFSLRFFLVLMIFLMFDVELSFLMQLPVLFLNWNSQALILMMGLMFILIIGLIEEWREGLLTWI